MVEDRVTDGERVAQLLASELSGRSDGPLDRFAVVDADPDAEPAPDGTLAFRVAVDGDRVGKVRIYPDGAEIRVEDASDGSENGSLDTGRLVEATRGDGLRAETTDDGVVVRIGYGAAVKRAVDALVAGVDT
jgi:hypothetical protein